MGIEIAEFVVGKGTSKVVDGTGCAVGLFEVRRVVYSRFIGRALYRRNCSEDADLGAFEPGRCW